MVRMWMIDPRAMCLQHLLGEHVEIHMVAGSLSKGRSIDGFIRAGLVETHSLKSRHDAIVAELNRRGHNGHKTPLSYKGTKRRGRINRSESLRELMRRCPDCRKQSRSRI